MKLKHLTYDIEFYALLWELACFKGSVSVVSVGRLIKALGNRKFQLNVSLNVNKVMTDYLK